MYTREQLFERAVPYFQGDVLATNVWIDKYALRVKGSPNLFLEIDPNQTIIRLANEIYRIESQYPNSLSYKEIYDTLDRFKYIVLGGSIMYGLGNDQSLSSLGNCFVIGNKVDSYGSICMIDQEQVQLMKRRGGVGHDLSHLRYDKAPVNGSAKTSTGAVSFAPRYSHSTREVAQDGRRGALMMSFHIKHPDANKFVTLKSDRTTCTGANVSLRFDDEFMQAIKTNSAEYTQQFPIDSKNPQIKKIIDPRKLWSDFCENAHSFAEPGALFWDTILRESLPSCYGDSWKEVSTNPCGEIPLCPYDSCRLVAINLYSYVKNPFTKKAYFDYDLFEKHVRIGMRIMDNIVDLEREKILGILKHIEEAYEDEETYRIEANLWKKVLVKLDEGRRTGFGIMGGADMLAALGFTYGTPSATDQLTEVMKFMAVNTYKTSIELAEERGSFPIFDHDKEKNNPFLNRILDELPGEINDKYEKYGRRNIACLTVAPTGSISIEALVNGGFEPVFLIAMKRNRKINPEDEGVVVDFVDEVGDSWERYTVVHKPFEDWYSINFTDLCMKFGELPNTAADCATIIIRQERGLDGKLKDITLLDDIIPHSPYFQSTANEIDVYEKIRMQGSVQKWIDHSISITHNLPKDFPLEEISDVYMTAWESGCKGCTVYRDESRIGVLNKLDSSSNDYFEYMDAVPRPNSVECDLHCVTALREKWIVIIGKIDGHPYEIFNFPKRNISKELFNEMFDIEEDQPTMKKNCTFEIQKLGKRKYCLNKLHHNTNVVDVCLIEDIVSLMVSDDDKSDTKRISLELRHRIDPRFIVQTIEKQYQSISAFELSMARVLKLYIKDGEISGLCPVCKKEKMIYQNGCPTCPNCGHSKCS